jgi:hypothetical protein
MFWWPSCRLKRSQPLSMFNGRPKLALPCQIWPSPAEYWPPLTCTSPPLAPFFSTTLITPAIASEPYCAEAPSRSTSMWSIAAIGMVLRSTACEPRPSTPLVRMRAPGCQRLPSTSTNTWSGDSPRNCAGRCESAVSAADGRGKVSDGMMRASAVDSSLVPVCCNTLAETTSIGVSELLSVRLSARVPVTITVSRFLALAVEGVLVSCAAALPARASNTAAGSHARAIGVRRLLIGGSPFHGLLRRSNLQTSHVSCVRQ